MPGASPHDDEDDDNFAALDFSADEPDSTVDAFDAFDAFVAIPSDEGAAEPEPQFAVTNPTGTVTVTTLMDGRVHRIDLGPAAVTLTESQLEEEIIEMAKLATLRAKSAQFTYMLDAMRQGGQDDLMTREFLTRELELPSPEDVDATQAALFASRYAGDDD